MGWFGKGKKATKAEKATLDQLREGVEWAFTARGFTRLEPAKWQDIPIGGVITGFGTLRDLHNLEDVHERVGERCGGGRYRCILRKQQANDEHIATYTFQLAGEPKIDGQPIPKKTKGAGPAQLPEIEEIKRGVQIKSAQMEELEVEAEYKRKREELGFDRPAVAPAQMIDAEEIRNGILAEVRAEFERKEKDREMREMRDKIARLEAGGTGSGSADLMALVTLIVDQSNRAADSKAEASKGVFDLAREAFQSGLQVATGGSLSDKGPTEWTDVIDNAITRTGETIAGVLEQRKAAGESVSSEQIKQIASDAAVEVKAELAAARALPSPSPNPPAATPKKFTEQQVRDGMNEVLQTIVAEAGTEKETWQVLAQEILPPKIIGQFAAAEKSRPQLEALLRKWGDPELVEQVIELAFPTQEEPAVSEPPAAPPPTVPPPAPPPAPAPPPPPTAPPLAEPKPAKPRKPRKSKPAAKSGG